jgi:hypothetical protein
MRGISHDKVNTLNWGYLETLLNVRTGKTESLTFTFTDTLFRIMTWKSPIFTIQDGMWVHARAGIRSISSGSLARLRIFYQFSKERIDYE